MAKLKEAGVKATRIFIKNILGIEELEIKPGGKITRISGENGTGKTSVIEAIKSILEGGVHDATLLRKGQKEGLIVLDLGDGVEMTKTIKADKSDFKVTHPDVGEISRGVTYLNKIRDKFSSNPVDFLTAKPAERVNILLNSVPMSIRREQVEFIPDEFASDMSFDGHALQIIESIRNTVFTRRSDVNRSVRDKEGTIETLSKAAPPSAPDGEPWSDRKIRLELEIKKLNAETKAKLAANKDEVGNKIEVGRNHYQYEMDKIDDTLRRSISELEKKAEADKEELRRSRTTEVEKINARALAENERIQVEYKEAFDPMKEALTTAENRVEEEIRFDESRRMLENLTEQRDALAAKSFGLTMAIEKLLALKSKLLESLPVAGLEVRDGDIFVDGIPFDRVNEAERVKLAVRLAVLRAGKLRLVVLDGLERLSAKTFSLLRKELESTDLQVIGSFVSSEDHLTIDSGEEVVE
jgi:hypothetical protein